MEILWKPLPCYHNWLALKYKLCIAAQNELFRILSWLLWNVYCVMYTGMKSDDFHQMRAMSEEWGEVEGKLFLERLYRD